MLAHVIIRPHKNDIDIFEEIMNKLPGFIEKITQSYIYTVEKDNSLDRHLHLIMSVKEDTRMDNQLRNFKKFINEKIKNRNSDLKVMFKMKIAKNKHDRQMVIGYICKDVDDEDLEIRQGSIGCKRNHYRHFAKGELEYPRLQCKKYYLSHSVEKPSDKVINILPQFAIAQCEEIFEKLNYKKNEIIPEMFTEMVHLGYSFLKMSRYQKKQLYLELKIRNDKEITKDLINQFQIEFCADDLNSDSYERYYNNLENLKTIKSNKVKIYKLYKLGFFSDSIMDIFSFDEENELKIYYSGNHSTN